MRALAVLRFVYPQLFIVCIANVHEPQLFTSRVFFCNR